MLFHSHVSYLIQNIKYLIIISFFFSDISLPTKEQLKLISIGIYMIVCRRLKKENVLKENLFSIF